jgi:hypothetical protein
MAVSCACACSSCRARSLLWPVVLVTLGALWLIGRAGGAYSFSQLWPILLIVAGVVKVAEALASREGHVVS